jgi:hypothetical protein
MLTNIVPFIPVARQRIFKQFPAEENARNNRTSNVKHRIRKHTSLTTEDVSSASSVQVAYKEDFI